MSGAVPDETRRAQSAQAANDRWVRALSAARHLAGPLPSSPLEPVHVAADIAPALGGAVASADALRRDDYTVQRGADGGASTQALRAIWRLAPAPGGLYDLGSEFHWGYAKALVALAPMQVGLLEMQGEARGKAWQDSFQRFETARDAFHKGFYAESLLELLAATEGDARSPGYRLEWRVHLLRALLLLGFPGGNMGLVDLFTAERAFAHAARYARADEPPVARQCAVAAAFCAFQQGVFQRARGYLDASRDLGPELPEALFLEARVRYAEGDRPGAESLLRRLFTIDRGYVVRAASEDELAGPTGQLAVFLDEVAREAWRAGSEALERSLDRVSFWRRHAKDRAAHPALARFEAFLREGKDWPLFDLLVLLGNRDDEVDRLLADAAGSRVVLTEVVPGPLVELEEPHVAIEAYKERVVVREKSLLRKEQVEWVDRTREVRTVRKVKRELPLRTTVVHDGGGRPLASVSLVGLPAATFRMGSPAEEPGRDPSEASHEVTLTRGVFVGDAPVTQGLWNAVMGTSPGFFQGDERPVEQVSWMDAVTFCNALSRLEGLPEAYVIDRGGATWRGPGVEGYRLPTEAEWEYACRAGSLSAYAGGADLDPAAAAFDRRHGAETMPVRSLAPNRFGLHDVHGNVWEWVWDAFSAFDGEPQTDPAVDGQDEPRVARGGSWATPAVGCRAAARAHFNLWHRKNNLGFRLALSRPAEEGAAARPATPSRAAAPSTAAPPTDRDPTDPDDLPGFDGDSADLDDLVDGIDLAGAVDLEDVVDAVKKTLS